jgi:hypothetical protein
VIDVSRCIAILLLALSSQLHAAVVFDNFGPVDSYQTFGWGLGVVPSSPDTYVGAAFTPAAAYALETLELPLFRSECVPGLQCTDTVNIFLMDSSADGRPNHVIELFPDVTPPIQMSPLESQGSLTILTSTFQPVLLPGARYWIVVSGQVILANWRENSIAELGPMMQDNRPFNQVSVFDDNERPAFRVHGALVPEPAEMIWSSIGLVLLIGRLSNRLKERAGSAPRRHQ